MEETPHFTKTPFLLSIQYAVFQFDLHLKCIMVDHLHMASNTCKLYIKLSDSGHNNWSSFENNSHSC